MDRALVGGDRCLAYRFGERRMDAADAGEILRRAAKFHEHASLGGQFACPAPPQREAPPAMRPLIADESMRSISPFTFKEM